MTASNTTQIVEQDALFGADGHIPAALNAVCEGFYQQKQIPGSKFSGDIEVLCADISVKKAFKIKENAKPGLYFTWLSYGQSRLASASPTKAQEFCCATCMPHFIYGETQLSANQTIRLVQLFVPTHAFSKLYLNKMQHIVKDWPTHTAGKQSLKTYSFAMDRALINAASDILLFSKTLNEIVNANLIEIEAQLATQLQTKVNLMMQRALSHMPFLFKNPEKVAYTPVKSDAELTKPALHTLDFSIH